MTVTDLAEVSEEKDRGGCLHVEFGDCAVGTCRDIAGTDEGARTNVESAIDAVTG